MDATITPGAGPVPEPPAFMADTEVTENRKDDGTLHTVTLTHGPTGLRVTAPTHDEAAASLGTEVASRAVTTQPADDDETVTIPRGDLDHLLAVATLYVGAFRPDEMMTLPEKFGVQVIEEVVERHGRRY